MNSDLQNVTWLSEKTWKNELQRHKERERERERERDDKCGQTRHETIYLHRGIPIKITNFEILKSTFHIAPTSFD